MNNWADMGQVVRLTQDMLAAAQMRDWTKVIALEQERQQLLQHEIPQHAEAMRQLSTVIAMNREIESYATQARTDAANAWDEMRKVRAAVDAYDQAKSA